MLVMVSFDFVHAMLIGILIAILFFTYTYSNVNIIRYVIRGNAISSSYERDPRAKKILSQYKEQIVYIKLQGYLFFGSSNTIIEHLRKLIITNAGQPIKYVIYDMSRVPGGDTSCAMSFEKISEYARDKNFQVLITGLDPSKQHSIHHKLSGIRQSTLVLYPQADHAINLCELTILKEQGYNPSEVNDLSIFLEDYIGDKSFATDIENYFQYVDVNENDYLIHQRDASHDLFYLESGLLAVYVEQADQTRYLISVIEPGNFIGEIAYYLHSQRSASVVALKKSKVRKIDFINAKKLRHSNPELAHAIEQAIITSLSYKLINTTQKLDVVSK